MQVIYLYTESAIYIVVSMTLTTLLLFERYKILYLDKISTYLEEIFKSIKIIKYLEHSRVDISEEDLFGCC